MCANTGQSKLYDLLYPIISPIGLHLAEKDSRIHALELILSEKDSRIHALESALAEEKISNVKLINDLTEKTLSNVTVIETLTEEKISNAKLINDLTEKISSNTIILETFAKIKQTIRGNTATATALIPFGDRDFYETIIQNADYNKVLFFKDFDIVRSLRHICTFLLRNSNNNHLIKHIIDNCININVDAPYDGYVSRRLIHLIIKYTNDEMIKYIIEKKNIDLNCADLDGNYPVHLICQKSSSIIIKNIINKYIYDPLIFDEAFVGMLMTSIDHNLYLNTDQKSELINLIKIND